MKEYYICLDVGGTEIKAAAVTPDGRLQGELKHLPSKSNGTENTIITNFTDIIKLIANEADGLVLGGIRLGFPGPFDYENGICLLRGLAKYDAINGVNLKQTISHFMQTQTNIAVSDDFDIRFINDVGGFALGEIYFGCAKTAKCAIFICIGTGCGSAFSVNGMLVNEEVSGVPNNGYIYHVPFRDGIIDDYISKRGLEIISTSIYGAPYDGRTLSELALKNDIKAINCFAKFGSNIHDAIMPIVSIFKPDCIVLGGQVMKSSKLFITPLETALNQNGISLYITENTSIRTIQGLLKI